MFIKKSGGKEINSVYQKINGVSKPIYKKSLDGITDITSWGGVGTITIGSSTLIVTGYHSANSEATYTLVSDPVDLSTYTRVMAAAHVSCDCGNSSTPGITFQLVSNGTTYDVAATSASNYGYISGKVSSSTIIIFKFAHGYSSSGQIKGTVTKLEFC